MSHPTCISYYLIQTFSRAALLTLKWFWHILNKIDWKCLFSPENVWHHFYAPINVIYICMCVYIHFYILWIYKKYFMYMIYNTYLYVYIHTHIYYLYIYFSIEFTSSWGKIYHVKITIYKKHLVVFQMRKWWYCPMWINSPNTTSLVFQKVYSSPECVNVFKFKKKYLANKNANKQYIWFIWNNPIPLKTFFLLKKLKICTELRV